MKCRICGNETGNHEYDVKEMMYGYRDVFAYFLCSKCGCLQIHEIPLHLTKYYDTFYYSYRPNQLHGQSSKIRRMLVRARNKYALFREGLIGKVLYSLYPTAQFDFFQPIRTMINLDSRILDVGCGAGHLLQILRDVGFNKLLGIDPFINGNITYENDLIIKKQNIHDVRGNYDIIMFHHSFEHVPDPLDVLRSAFALLVPGGYCMIRIPIVSSYAWDHYGIKWVQLDAPRHFYLHSLESMGMLSTKVGFELCDIVYDSTAFQLWGSEQYVRDIPLYSDRSYMINPSNSIFSDKDIALFNEQAEHLNVTRQGDQAIFYLRKSHEISA